MRSWPFGTRLSTFTAGRARVERLEVLARRAPGDGQVVGVAVDRAARDGRIANREAAEAAVADDLGRDALVDRAHRARIHQQRVVGVAVDVDEARCDRETGRRRSRVRRPSICPMPAMRPSSIATSATRPSAPVPSYTVPLRITSFTRGCRRTPSRARGPRRTARARTCCRRRGRARRRRRARRSPARA